MRLIILLVLAWATNVVAAPLSQNTTVGQFAIECQHPASKTDPDARLRRCMDFVNVQRLKVMERQKSIACVEALNNTPPGALAETVFAMAMEKEHRSKPADSALLALIVISTPACQASLPSR